MTNSTTDRLDGALHQMATFQDGNAQPHTIALINELADIARSQQAEIDRLREALRVCADCDPECAMFVEAALGPQPGKDEG